MALTPAASGILYPNKLDEGAVLFDYDLDGDMDLFVHYFDLGMGVRVFESRGDGTFFEAAGLIDNPSVGIGLGISAADWDNDGDFDLTMRHEFRRNQLVETGQRKFTVASHTIPSGHLICALPAWGDFDKDGDLDCAIADSCPNPAHLYRNVTYDDATPLEQRRYVRVRRRQPSSVFPEGLDNEFGATVTLWLHGDPEGLRRRQFTASSAGYLTQNEYTLTFGLPPDPTPGDPATDLRFDVSVDFPGPPGGYVRVDRHVNPLLADIPLAMLDDREIVILRDGTARVGGCELGVAVADSPHLRTSGGGLDLPANGHQLADVQASPTPDRWVGVELDATAATEPARIAEILLDGQLDAPVACGGDPYNVAIWDVSATPPEMIASWARVTSDRNDRTDLRVDAMLPAGARYRVVARVTSRRGSTVFAPVSDPTLVLAGALDFQDASPCSGAAVAAASVDVSQAYLAVRFREDDASWFDLGGGSPTGGPALSVSGDYRPGTPVTLTIAGAAPNAPAALLIGRDPSCQPLLGATIWPRADLVFSGFAADAVGSFSFSATVPTTVPEESRLLVQALVADPTAPFGVAITNACASP